MPRMDYSHTPVRRCLASGALRPQGKLVRFIVGPDNDVIPDIAGKLPGRGLWVTASRSDLEHACDKNLFSSAAKANVRVPDGLADTVGHLLRQNCLGLLGLCRKAGDLVTGFEKVKSCIAAGDAAVLICAQDGADDGRQKLQRLARDTPQIGVLASAEMSLVLGRENVVHAALKDGGLARRLVQEAHRLSSYEAASVSDDG